MSGLFSSNLFTLAHKSLDFRIKRHDLLASNIANKDTSGYQAEDLVFEVQLEKAFHADEPGPLRRTDLRHFDGNQTSPLQDVEAQRIQKPVSGSVTFWENKDKKYSTGPGGLRNAAIDPVSSNIQSTWTIASIIE